MLVSLVLHHMTAIQRLHFLQSLGNISAHTPSFIYFRGVAYSSTRPIPLLQWSWKAACALPKQWRPTGLIAFFDLLLLDSGKSRIASGSTTRCLSLATLTELRKLHFPSIDSAWHYRGAKLNDLFLLCLLTLTIKICLKMTFLVNEQNHICQNNQQKLDIILQHIPHQH